MKSVTGRDKIGPVKRHLLLGMILSSACGGAAKDDVRSPDGAIRGFVAAMATGDVKAAARFLLDDKACEAFDGEARATCKRDVPALHDQLPSLLGGMKDFQIATIEASPDQPPGAPASVRVYRIKSANGGPDGELFVIDLGGEFRVAYPIKHKARGSGATVEAPSTKGNHVDAAKSDLDGYRKYLESTKIASDDAKEAPELALNGWRFFLRSTMPGDKRDAATISPNGEIVSERIKNQWNAFLGQAGVSAADLANRSVWLLGQSGVVDKDSVADKAAKQLVAPPSLKRESDGTLVLTFWQISPPNMSSPYRVTITAHRTGDATIESTFWKDVSNKQ